MNGPGGSALPYPWAVPRFPFGQRPRARKEGREAPSSETLRRQQATGLAVWWQESLRSSPCLVMKKAVIRYTVSGRVTGTNGHVWTLRSAFSASFIILTRELRLQKGRDFPSPSQ